MKSSNEEAILILAAGNSKRLGQEKQLLKYQDKSLLFNACKKAKSVCDEVFVVLGHEKNKCEEEIKTLDVNIIENKNYKQGLSTSIIEGINALSEYKKVLIMLCDQPFIPKKHLKTLLENSLDENKIYCSFYKECVAVPAVFSFKFYDKLLSLQEDIGAKKIIQKSNYEIVHLEDSLALDIDTKEDLKYLL